MNDFSTVVNTMKLGELIATYPLVTDFLENYNLMDLPKNQIFVSSLTSLPKEHLSLFGLTIESTLRTLILFLTEFTKQEDCGAINEIETLTICGGQNKSGEVENCSLCVKRGEVISIVGPTGSGKSRLLGDIECLAQGDTPTKRKILINGMVPTDAKRFEMSGRLVAQLSQNMNFVMDLSVRDFLTMHAKSRFVANIDEVVSSCFTCANELAGEKFTMDTKVTLLSGGQSRSLMIADTACMSSSPIVLIDEIENAGIDRREAIKILTQNQKIILISTHDPYLALTAQKRIIIKNGGIHNIIETSQAEKDSLSYIEALDNELLDFRRRLRLGEPICVKGGVHHVGNL